MRRITPPLLRVLVSAIFLTAAAAFAAVQPEQDNIWSQSPALESVQPAQTRFFHVAVSASDLPVGFRFIQGEVYVVVRQPERDSGRGPIIVGRCAALASPGTRREFVFYKSLETPEPLPGDHLFYSGPPATDAERKLIGEASADFPEVDRELSDLYGGLMSFKTGFYRTLLSTTTNTDSNYYKQSAFNQWTFGLRWWFEFAPQLGLNVDYATGNIPITDFHRNPETGQQSSRELGLVYRARFIGLPTIFGISYFSNAFTTTNTDDYVLGTAVSGFNLNVTFHELLHLHLIDRGGFGLEINNLELGGTLFPFLTVQDTTVSRGDGSANAWKFNGGIEFHISKLAALRNFFYVFEGGLQRLNLDFSGKPSDGVQPNNSGHEFQSWFGFRLKFNIPDYIGKLIKDS